MSDPAAKATLDQVVLLCDHPECELAIGSYGQTSGELGARITGTRPAMEGAPPDDEDPEVDDDDDSDEDEDEDEDEAEDVEGIDPSGEGAPCPSCAEASPPRDGTLLAVPTDGVVARALAAAAGWRGLAAWQLVQGGTKGTSRLLEVLGAIGGGATPASPKKRFVVGGATLTAVVLTDLPFDGHLLSLGNSDEEVRRAGKKKFAPATAAYGPEQAPPGPRARAEPRYVKELQEDLLWLGYFSRSRGSPPCGELTYHVLGAVLGFKQDLVEIYGIATTDTRESVAPGSVAATKFARPIHYQTKLVSPAGILGQWSERWAGKGGGLAGELSAIAGAMKQLPGAKGKSFDRQLAMLEKRVARVEATLADWPHVAALEQLGQPFMPFAPKAASKSFDDLAIPTDTKPEHSSTKALLGDGVWSDGKFGARKANRAALAKAITAMLVGIERAKGHCTSVETRVGSFAAPAGDEVAWSMVSPRLVAAARRCAKLGELVRFWTLDAKRQIVAWRAHLVELGTLDQPTAIYLKALRQGGRIGPHDRPAYQLFADPPDVHGAQQGADRIRKLCTDRARNTDGKRATAMPEVLALQIFFNEGAGVFSQSIRPFNTAPGDKRRLPLLGIDVRLPAPGVFDPTYHKGGDWFRCRGWGTGQTTYGDAKVDGVELVRGLPIMPPGATAVRHPRSFTSFDASLASAVDERAIPKYDNSLRIDCSYGKLPGKSHYDCQTCLRRFFDESLVSGDKHGQGSVFVPISRRKFGELSGATAVFVDLERYTKFAHSASSALGDLETETQRLFGRTWTPAAAHVVDALASGPSIEAAAKQAGDKHGLAATQVEADVRAHIRERTDLPCSWMRARIRYAGSGPRAIASLHSMLRVVGNGEGKPLLQKNIAEAAALRRKP